MSAKRSAVSVNRLLDSLPAAVKQRILDNSDNVKLNFGELLCEYGEEPQHVYFPLSCQLSLVICIDDHAPFKLAMIGADGMLGAHEVLDVNEAAMREIVREEGYAIKLTRPTFRDLLQNSSPLQVTVKRYLFGLMSQANRTTGCNQFHRVSSRLARWLLLTNDCHLVTDPATPVGNPGRSAQCHQYRSQFSAE
ncbi:Crp/Fnr family transcriptional regulator [Pseudohongiella sp.]|uniref:Cyclic nucleotide-binding domain-containing protein n=1 Tax=marine sediment metagenome TaxID=412755 RepID=A0A0F9YH16_9ZZZZ|nr:Crp/Fnr family transcriptional regulator [Pseudohongiella sp.]HDZ09216.1 Crp/Fnr family transcriptional regulator [Pseudohongiella sp.]HEA63356.1 Crp/Fnr family transcriptional regulator [Pseudohongiella sp.]